MTVTKVVGDFITLFVLIDPIGTVPVFIAVTALEAPERLPHIARRAILISGAILLAFIVGGELLLDALGITLPAFQIAGGIVLFLFALTMIFGDSKPDEEKRLHPADDVAVFPLAVPSIAGPGSMLGVVVLTDNHRHSVSEQLATTVVLAVVLALTWLLLRSARSIRRRIGDTGAGIVSRVMGLVLASIAVQKALEGVSLFFSLAA